ncbi:MAG: alpha-galactosidase [Ruminococcaceae bacterium]|nr:alpha-galactosidase [Oscillospiraceae bacterium]
MLPYGEQDPEVVISARLTVLLPRGILYIISLLEVVMAVKNLSVNNREFFISSEVLPEQMALTLISENNGLYEYLFRVTDPTAPITIKWCIHMEGILSFWCPTAKRERRIRQWYAPSTCYSNLYYGAPLLAAIEQGDINRQTVALSDAVSPIKMTFSVNDFEEKENLDFHIHLFEEDLPAGEYTLHIRIDERPLLYSDCIGEVSAWWKRFYPTDKKQTETGEYPLYSSWYNYHQHPNEESLLKELRLAAECGFRSLIIDDGWSYDGNGTGDYINCGNWQVAASKFPDFAGFVEQCHQIGIKVALWFPVPFVGFHTEDYEKLSDKLLYNSPGFRAGILDPRYPETRKYITDAYVKIVSEYNLDGLKLDFIDSFKKRPDFVKVTGQADGKDCEKVEEGVAKLLRDIREQLTSQKEDFMIEFRQDYVGPAMTKECNMLRVGDCPFESLTNRIGTIDLRLLNHELAVHADMLVWAQNESAENIAKMLLNIMFGVPQISVLLQESTEKQLTQLKNHIKYWYDNRDVLLHGHFKACAPECLYALASSESDDKRIAVSYTKNDFLFDGKQTDLFNATASDIFYLENAADAPAAAVICDPYGTEIAAVEIPAGVCRLNIPQGGRAEITLK